MRDGGFYEGAARWRFFAEPLDPKLEQAMVSHVLKPCGARRVLHVACEPNPGIGLAQQGYEVTSLFFPGKMRTLKLQAEEYVRGHNVRNVRILEADWRRLSGSVGHGFDAVVHTSNSLYHFPPEEQEQILSNIHEVLKHGGLYYVETWRLNRELKLLDREDKEWQFHPGDCQISEDGKEIVMSPHVCHYFSDEEGRPKHRITLFIIREREGNLVNLELVNAEGFQLPWWTLKERMEKVGFEIVEPAPLRLRPGRLEAVLGKKT